MIADIGNRRFVAIKKVNIKKRKHKVVKTVILFIIFATIRDSI